MELREAGIAPIRGENVLGKVVRSYAEKVHAERELLDENRRGGHFDHDP